MYEGRIQNQLLSWRRVKQLPVISKLARVAFQKKKNRKRQRKLHRNLKNAI